jgi:hypothetical protein
LVDIPKLHGHIFGVYLVFKDALFVVSPNLVFFLLDFLPLFINNGIVFELSKVLLLYQLVVQFCDLADSIGYHVKVLSSLVQVK